MRRPPEEDDSMRTLNVALIGQAFMGKAHSHAWRNAGRFIDLPATPVLKVAVGRDQDALRAFAERWGWEETAADWREVVRRDDVDVVDVSVPNDMHAEIAIAAAEAGKHVFCEKPIALDSDGARRMLAAAESAGVVHYLNHNYRRAPAVMLAKQLIDEGFVGRIYHWRGAYLQDWIMDPEFPLTWHLRAERAGAGPHFDLGSHNVDLARFLVGEIASVSAMTARFIEERPLPGAGAATFSAGSGGGGEKGQVTVEDAAFVVAEFENGALGSIETSRFALGRKNQHTFEIFGSDGSITFDLERMNELQVFSRHDPAHIQGFRTVLATESVHPYVAAWWPPGHIIGYEHAFHHAVADFVKAVVDGEPLAPTFADGLRETLVLEAALASARTGRRTQVEAA
jgi:predicted dehydrogenase